MATKDFIRVDIALSFVMSVRAKPYHTDIKHLAMYLGTDWTNQPDYFTNLLGPSFGEAVQLVIGHFTYQELLKEQERVIKQIAHEIGTDSFGLNLEKIQILSLSKTPLAFYQKGNVIDEIGRKRLAEFKA